MLTNMTYYRAFQRNREVVSATVVDGEYKTDISIDVQLLLYGIRTFACGDGTDYKLTDEETFASLKLIKQEREKIIAVDGVKTLKMWEDSGIGSAEEYFRVGDKVAEDIVDMFRNSLPPHRDSSQCFQLGEEYSFAPDAEGNILPTYITFHRISDDVWQYDGICFTADTKSVATYKPHVDAAIEELTKNK